MLEEVLQVRSESGRVMCKLCCGLEDCTPCHHANSLLAHEMRKDGRERGRAQGAWAITQSASTKLTFAQQPQVLEGELASMEGFTVEGKGRALAWWGSTWRC